MKPNPGFRYGVVAWACAVFGTDPVVAARLAKTGPERDEEAIWPESPVPSHPLTLGTYAPQTGAEDSAVSGGGNGVSDADLWGSK